MHGRFNYKTGEELVLHARSLGFQLPFSDDVSPLFRPALIEDRTIGNRILVQPMEGYDSETDGSPSFLTSRRYRRYSGGGSGVIWIEAVSVSEDGRSNPRQLWMTEKNCGNFSRLTELIRNSYPLQGLSPFLVIQLTHSGRYSNPGGIPAPRTASPNPILDRITPYILTDDELMVIQDQFVASARLAYRAGFDAVDLKACHGYLMIDLLASRGRERSRFGGPGSSERFRFLLDTISRIREEVPHIIVTTRLNISDLYVDGFGVDGEGKADFSEPFRLVEKLGRDGMKLINLSMGSPYFNPHVARPYDTPLPGRELPEEHPLQGVVRILESTALFQKRFPGMLVAGSAYSWLRQFAPNVGAAILRDGGASFIGFGRNSFAYPSMPADLLKEGRADPRKTCITCSGCTRLIRNFMPGGCVIRDKEIYGPMLKKLIADGK